MPIDPSSAGLGLSNLGAPLLRLEPGRRGDLQHYGCTLVKGRAVCF